MNKKEQIEYIPKYEVNIDFDEASKKWRRNKKAKRGGYFIYCCGSLKSNGKYCRKPPWYFKGIKKGFLEKKDYGKSLCTWHLKKKYNM